MGHESYLEELIARFPNFEEFKDHVEDRLNTREQIKADYSRLPADHPKAGVLCTLAIPNEIIATDISPIPYVNVIYEKRSDKMKNHPGQMAFPGGTYEEQDNGSIIQTAYREANEEVGIDPSDLEFIAFMDEFLASSNILVHPVVSWLKSDLPVSNFQKELTKKYQPLTSESIATVVMPLTHLLNPHNYESSIVNKYGRKWHSRYFYTKEIRPDDNIWGLTASMTRRLLDILFPDNLLPEEASLR